MEREIKAFSKKKKILQVDLKVFNDFSDLIGIALKDKQAEG